MKTLNDQYNYGLQLFLLSIDEGITGYRDDSLEVFALFHLSRVDIKTMADCKTKSNTI